MTIPYCKKDLYNKTVTESVHLTLSPHIISVQVKSRSMLLHGSMGPSLNKIKNPNLNPNH